MCGEEQAAHQVSRAASRGAWRSSRPTSAELPLGGALHISAAPASRGAPGPSARYLQETAYMYHIITNVSDSCSSACHLHVRLSSHAMPYSNTLRLASLPSSHRTAQTHAWPLLYLEKGFGAYAVVACSAALAGQILSRLSNLHEQVQPDFLLKHTILALGSPSIAFADKSRAALEQHLLFI